MFILAAEWEGTFPVRSTKKLKLEWPQAKISQGHRSYEKIDAERKEVMAQMVLKTIP